jgi:hypothetical protein
MKKKIIFFKKMIVLFLSLIVGFYSMFDAAAQMSDDLWIMPQEAQETTESSFDGVWHTFGGEETEMPRRIIEEAPEHTEWVTEETAAPANPIEHTEWVTEGTTAPTEHITAPTSPANNTEWVTEGMTAPPEQITSEAKIPQKKNGIISGLIWVDGNGDLETDWDGLYNGYEQPLANYNVYLYLPHDLSAPVAIAQTDYSGSYTFDNLELGSYVLGIESYTAHDGSEYLLPFGMTADCKFAIDWNSTPIRAYTETILLEGGQIENINAGMRLPADPDVRTPDDPALKAGSTIGEIIEATNINGTVKIDNVNWYVVRKKDVDGVKYAMLMQDMMLPAPRFSPTEGVHNSKYENSNMQKYITNLLDSSNMATYQFYSTIYSMAVEANMNPDIGSGSSGRYTSYYTTTEPTAKLAKPNGIKKNVLFIPTYKDFTGWGTWVPNSTTLSAPGDHVLQQYWTKIWGRTESAKLPDQVCGYNNTNNANVMDEGFYTQTTYSSSSGSSILVWVWVRTSPIKITVHYVDTDDNPISSTPPPTLTYTKIYEVKAGDTFTHTPPLIEGYQYVYWKDSDKGAHNTNPVIVEKVAGNMDIYLVYTKESIKTDVTVSKTVKGNFADFEKEFTFTVSFKDSSGKQLTSGTFEYTGTVVPQSSQLTVIDGKAEFTLKHGQEIIIKGVPADYWVRISETPVKGYEAAFTDSAGSPAVDAEGYSVVGKDARTFKFTNTMVTPPPTGVDAGTWTMAAILISVAALFVLGFVLGFVVIKVMRKRKRNQPWQE